MSNNIFTCFDCGKQYDRTNLVERILDLPPITPSCDNCERKFNRPTILNKIFLNDSKLIMKYDRERWEKLRSYDDLYDSRELDAIAADISNADTLNQFSVYVRDELVPRIVDEIKKTSAARRAFIDVYFKDYPLKICRYTSISKFDCDLLVDRLRSIRDFFQRDKCDVEKFGTRHNYVSSPTFFRLSTYKNKDDAFEDCLVSTA